MSRVANEIVTLARGTHGAEVGNLQRFLIDSNHRDPNGEALVADEVFGPKTEHAIREMQRSLALSVTGSLDRATRRAIGPLGFIPFVQAKNYTLRSSRAISLIVIHTMECHETSLTAAEDVADWFAGRTSYPPPMASAHYCIDRDSVVQCVREVDEAWHANQANRRGIGIEHAGFARQTADDWSDHISSAILLHSARLVARICRERSIPVHRLSPEDIRSGAPGICGHVDVNRAYGNKGGHTDPGEHFPWASYLALVEES